jgi:hypothetical protein
LCGFENPMRDAKTAELKRQIGQVRMNLLVIILNGTCWLQSNTAHIELNCRCLKYHNSTEMLSTFPTIYTSHIASHRRGWWRKKPLSCRSMMNFKKKHRNEKKFNKVPMNMRVAREDELEEVREKNEKQVQQRHCNATR